MALGFTRGIARIGRTAVRSITCMAAAEALWFASLEKTNFDIDMASA